MFKQMNELFKANSTQNEESAQVQINQTRNVENIETAEQERANAIKEIHQQMMELNKIYKTTASLVDEQSCLVDNIRSSISSTSENVQDASLNVRKAEASTSSCCIS